MVLVNNKIALFDKAHSSRMVYSYCYTTQSLMYNVKCMCNRNLIKNVKLYN